MTVAELIDRLYLTNLNAEVLVVGVDWSRNEEEILVDADVSTYPDYVVIHSDTNQHRALVKSELG